MIQYMHMENGAAKSTSKRWMYEVGDDIELAFKKPALSKKDMAPFVVNVLQKRGHKKVSISVVIVAYSESESLLRMLTNLQRQVKDGHEIIVVDNGLPAKTVQQIKKQTSNYIRLKENYGPSLARNIGAVYARGDIVAFLDADGEVLPDYVDQIHNAWSDQTIVAVRGRVKVQTPHSYAPSFYDLGSRPTPYYINLEGISALRRKDFVRAGGFEASLYGVEGAVLCYRMIEFYGYKPEQFYYQPNLVLLHDYDKGREAFEQKAIRTEEVSLKIRRRYPFIGTMIENYKQNIEPQLHSEAHMYDKKQGRIMREAAQREAEYFRAHHKQKTLMGGGRINSPKFSVVIPFYNAGVTIEQTVSSILSQSLQDIEIIIVDDVSDDPNSINKLNQLTASVTVIRNSKNVGCGQSRNRGIRQARAPYILCLDSDDFIEPTYLEKAYNAFEADATVGGVSSWAQNFGMKSGVWKPKDNPGIEDALVDSPIPGTSCFRKKVWKDNGGYRGRGHFEDWEFWLGALTHGWRIRVIPAAEFHYRVSTTQMTRRTHKKAAQLMTNLLTNFPTAYDEQYKDVIAKKHQKIFDLRMRNNDLEYEVQKLHSANQELQHKIGLRAASKGVVHHYGGKVQRAFRRLRFGNHSH